MDNNPGDSSSESDISDPWSLVDRDSCDTDEIPGVNSGVTSVCGELSDGESLEVIDEEDHHEGEFQEAGIDTDGVSIITDSEINEELDQTLPAALSKEKKYLHHPNTYLNTRLNVLLALSFAAVTGLGVGHFIGLQEECPLLDTTLTAQLAKLQEENGLLQHKLNQLLQEGQVPINHKNEDWECGTESKLRNNGLDLGSCLELEVKELPLQHTNRHTEPEHLTEFGFEQLNHVNLGAVFKIIQSNRDPVDNEINNNFVEDQHKENAISNMVLDEEKEDAIEDKFLDEHLILANTEDETVIGLKGFIQNLNNRLHLNDVKDKHMGNNEGSDELNRIQVEENLKTNINMEGTYEEMEKRDVLKDAENVININNNENDSDSSFMIKGEENFTGSSSSVSNDKFIYPSNIEDNMIDSEEHISVVDENSQQNHIYPEVSDDANKEESSLDENNLQIIKSTLKLLKVHFDKDILSADTGSVLSFAFALAMEHEQSLIHLQNTITQCKIKNDNFCIQFHKRMKISARKLKETTEQLVDDIDEQMHKLLTRIVRKFKKYKNNVQSKWCHLKNGHDGTNDWLESSVLLNCKENSLKSKSNENSFKRIVKNSLKYKEKRQNPEMILDKSFATETLSEHNNKQSKFGNDELNYEKVLPKNWEQNKHKMKDSYKKDKKGRGNNKNFSQNQKTEFQHTKPEWANNQEKEWNDPKTKNDRRDTLRKGNMYYKPYVILDYGKTWPSLNIASSKQNNISGDWVLKLADGRAEQRKLSHRSDWVFDRADARKIKREKYEMKDDWYFQRARGRENCRYNSYSDWCKGGIPNDWYHHNKPENERKFSQTNRWSKKFTRTFASAGKWVKDSFSKFHNKINYHHH